MKESNDYKLTKDVSVGQLRSWMNDKSDHSKVEIIELIAHRFKNRYLKHVSSIDSGFLIMAVSCLIIETIQSFREGEEDTNGIGKRMFKNFFGYNQEFFPGFSEISDEFYKNIRCGILHQSETTNAWRILRIGKIVDNQAFTINANLFLKSLEKAADKYLEELAASEFNSLIWVNAFLKLHDICENCKRKA